MDTKGFNFFGEGWVSFGGPFGSKDFVLFFHILLSFIHMVIHLNSYYTEHNICLLCFGKNRVVRKRA